MHTAWGESKGHADNSTNSALRNPTHDRRYEHLGGGEAIRVRHVPDHRAVSLQCSVLCPEAALTAMVVCLTWGCQAPAAALCAPVLGPPQPPPPPQTTTTTFCSVIPIHPWKQSYGMEQVWQAEFQKLFSQYVPQTWYLLPVVQRPIGVNWQTFVDSAKVRFCCEECGHGWTSMKGRISFWFLLTSHGEGLVTFKLYGQQCDKCKVGRYEPAMWYPEEVVKVLVNIYNRVGQVYYGFQQPPIHKNRRPGKPRNPHNADLCQACKDGVCSERR